MRSATREPERGIKSISRFELNILKGGGRNNCRNDHGKTDLLKVWLEG